VSRPLSPVPFLCALALALDPGTAFAHGSERGFILLLPTDYYLMGGAFAVAASFFLLAFMPARRIEGLASQRLPLAAVPRLPPAVPSFLSFAFLAFLVLAGFFGSRDPLSNPLPLFIWTAWWVGFSLLHAVLGNLWALFNPWSGPLRLAAWLSGGRIGRAALLPLPERLGYAPAIVIFFAFAWFELVDLAPSDPARLATAVALYWLFAFAGMVVFGETPWKARAEPFSIFFGLIAGMAPLAWERISGAHGYGPRPRIAVFLAWPGRRLMTEAPLPLSGALFVLLALASVSFDGFSRTFTWLSFIGINPLEFPGRSAVQVENTLGLLAAFGLLAGGFLGAVGLGCAYVGRPDLLRRAAGQLVYSIVPISIAFHAAHYLTSFLVDGQYVIGALSDPFGLEWDLLGIGHYHVTTSFLKNIDDVTLIWNVQTAIICVGHIVGIVMAHVIALRYFHGLRMAVSSQFGLATLMVFYTGFGLWLLSTPTGA
jgi:hypothetical protein